MKIDDLQKHEQVAFGGLLRMMIRSDGDFTEEEENKVNLIGDELGGRGAIWRMISASAQECPTEDRIRAAVPAVERPEVRELITSTLKGVAGADGLAASEQMLLDWLEGAWS